jgi:RNA-directed DNA polymerase
MAQISKALSQVRSQDTALKGVKRLEVDANWRKLKYVRYADDILLGFIGPRKEAVSILIEISNFASVYCSMDLNILKSGVVHHEKGVEFLGYKIWKKYGLKQKLLIDKRGFKKREESNRLNFGVPLDKLFSRFAERGFLKQSKLGRETR